MVLMPPPWSVPLVAGPIPVRHSDEDSPFVNFRSAARRPMRQKLPDRISAAFVQ
jgi:hypothetical protein